MYVPTASRRQVRHRELEPVGFTPSSGADLAIDSEQSILEPDSAVRAVEVMSLDDHGVAQFRSRLIVRGTHRGDSRSVGVRSGCEAIARVRTEVTYDRTPSIRSAQRRRGTRQSVGTWPGAPTRASSSSVVIGSGVILISSTWRASCDGRRGAGSGALDRVAIQNGDLMQELHAETEEDLSLELPRSVGREQIVEVERERRLGAPPSAGRARGGQRCASRRCARPGAGRDSGAAWRSRRSARWCPGTAVTPAFAPPRAAFAFWSLSQLASIPRSTAVTPATALASLTAALPCRGGGRGSPRARSPSLASPAVRVRRAQLHRSEPRGDRSSRGWRGRLRPQARVPHPGAPAPYGCGGGASRRGRRRRGWRRFEHGRRRLGPRPVRSAAAALSARLRAARGSPVARQMVAAGRHPRDVCRLVKKRGYRRRRCGCRWRNEGVSATFGWAGGALNPVRGRRRSAGS